MVFQPPGDPSTTGTITAAQGVLSFRQPGCAVASVQITGTWTGTLVFEATVDGGTTWFAIPAINPANGLALFSVADTSSGTAKQYIVPIASFQYLRLRASAWSSGTASLVIAEAAGVQVVYLANGLPYLGAGEDITNNKLIVEQRYTPFSISTATTTTVKSGAGYLDELLVAGGTLGTVTAYDNTAGSGTLIVPAVTPVSGACLIRHVTFATGLTIVTAAATVLSGGYR